MSQRCRTRAAGDDSKLVEKAEGKLEAKEAAIKKELKKPDNEEAETKKKLEESLKTIDSLKEELEKAAGEAKKE